MKRAAEAEVTPRIPRIWHGPFVRPLTWVKLLTGLGLALLLLDTIQHTSLLNFSGDEGLLTPLVQSGYQTVSSEVSSTASFSILRLSEPQKRPRGSHLYPLLKLQTPNDYLLLRWRLMVE